MSFTHDTWVGPFSWRYGSPQMRQLWSETHKRRLWRRIWVALAEAQMRAGLVQVAQVDDLRARADDVNIDRSHELEAILHHDLMAELRCFAEQCPVGGGILHLGATSMDIEDNADALRLRASLSLVGQGLRDLLLILARKTEEEADHVCIGWTHLQPAEPTTVGYRLAGYAQDLLADYEALLDLQRSLRGKGFKGAVGTAASWHQLLEGRTLTAEALEADIMDNLGLAAFPVATQTCSRRQDWQYVTLLAGIGMTLYRLAFDLRLLQSPPVGEWAEPFAEQQVGSSAMPFKRNPVNAENIDSLARYLAALPRVAWDNGAHNLLERTLDDSANRRIVLPQASLCCDEMLRRTRRILEGLRLDDGAIRHNLERYGTFAATERVLMAACLAGGDRQHLHEVIRGHSMNAWQALSSGEPNPLTDLLCGEEELLRLLSGARIRELMRAQDYVGDAPGRARAMAGRVLAACARGN
ncbi:MAG: adenylosuccinate lyase [Anaerolineaceae bacterium]|nr:adenylosuccinate lyase [Anaerolineaceae bacterium]MDE0328355.1 adenylosuccinate lyase [Anaerolineaceae bacterium]